ncbi:MAG: response regulator [bacterium]
MAKRKNILIIDDEVSWLHAVSHTLRDHGFKVKEAMSAIEALDVLIKFKPDLIVSDLRMPDMNGFELLDKIRQMPKNLTTPVVFLSAIEDFAAKKVAKDMGAADCVAKPYHKDEILPLLSKYLPQ